MVVTVNRGSGTSGAVSVQYATQDGSGTSAATAGTNYTAKSGTLTWASGASSAQTISIPVTTSPSFSGIKSFKVNLSSPTGGASLGTSSAAVNVTGAGSSGLAVRVQGNHLVDAQGNSLQLRGVNVSGLEFVAIQNWSSDPWGGAAPNWSVVKSWKANAVRLPLNQASWLKQTCKDPASGATRSADPGNNYVATVTKAVNDATAAGLYVILDLHMSAPGTYCPMIQNAMADKTNSIAFWTSLAQTFKDKPNVIFELFNEPFLTNTPFYGTYFSGDGWQYMMKGTGAGPITGFTASTLNGTQMGVSFPWEVASMQSMLDAVRATGATNVVLVAGLMYASAFDGWLANHPTDSQAQMAAVWHAYPTFGATFGTAAAAQPNWAPQIFTQAQGILDAGIPIVITELGDRCSDGTTNSPEVTNMVNWADAHNVSVLGWGFNTRYSPGAGCEDVLLKDASGTPTPGYGQVFHDWLVNHR